MEVHHHSHSPRRKWTHYFWEFLMLFLAVFCGYLAEVQFEHRIEHQREKQYMKTFIADLGSDADQTATFIPLLDSIRTGMDSLRVALKKDEAIKKPGDIYRYAKYLKEDLQFISAERTMQQVKNSGNMRLIRKSVVSDSLMIYDHFIRFSDEAYGEVAAIRKEVHSFVDEIIDERTLSNYDGSSNVSLLINDRYKLDVLYNKLTRLMQKERQYIGTLQFINSLALRMINLIEREYHIK